MQFDISLKRETTRYWNFFHRLQFTATTETGASRHHGARLRDPPETPRTSQQYWAPSTGILDLSAP